MTGVTVTIVVEPVAIAIRDVELPQRRLLADRQQLERRRRAIRGACRARRRRARVTQPRPVRSTDGARRVLGRVLDDAVRAVDLLARVAGAEADVGGTARYDASPSKV